MAELDIGQSTTTDMTNNVDDYSVDPKTLDSTSALNETEYTFPDANKYEGYYQSIPELKSAIDNLAIYTVGKGYEVEVGNEIDIDAVNGSGEDTFLNILWNMQVTKKYQGDAFAEIIRDDKSNRLVNLIPLDTAQMSIVQNSKGRIIRYEQRTAKGKSTRFKPEDILHIANDRVGNSIHGISVIPACQWVIDARNEALTDERKIKHRELALGILYVDTEDPTKIAAATKAYQDAVNKGEVLVFGNDVAKLEDSKVSPRERLAWIQYLEGFFYQAVKVPRTIANSDGTTEAGGKIGYLTYEMIYNWEQKQFEADIWQQLGIKLTFNKPPSLQDNVASDESKNTGQLGFQPEDTNVDVGVTPDGI